MLGAGHILVQRYGDILDGKRTWANELARTNVRPTLKDAVAGDITAAMPYRAMVNIIEVHQDDGRGRARLCQPRNAAVQP